MKEKELFQDPRWTEYQDVKPLKIKVPFTEKDKKNIEEFRKFIDEKAKKDTKNK